MQLFGNVATEPVRKESKTTNKVYYEFRVCESTRGPDPSPTWYSVRVMKSADPNLKKGDFVKVTGKLKVDFYIGRDGKPTGTLLVIAFEAAKISKPAIAPPESAAAGQKKVQEIRQEEAACPAEEHANWDALV